MLSVIYVVLFGCALVGMGVLARLLVSARRKSIDAAQETQRQRQAETLRELVCAHERAEVELRRAKEAAEAANVAKTRYLVAISHEIRTPLNAIYGYAQLLERQNAISPAEAGGVIRRSAEHLTNLVEGLLDISKIESGVFTVRQDTVRLPVLLDHVVDMFRMQAAAKGLTLDYVVEGRLPVFVRTDEKRLKQILINLLSNAVKYTKQGGATLSVTYRSQMAFVEVTDTGIGIPPEDIERIFEPFERGNSPDASLQPGIGLGLAITRAIAQILGGEVTVSSEPGRGSRFLLRMMLPEPMAVPASTSSYDCVIGYKGGKKTILVIDDNPAHIDVVQHLLRPLDFIVFSATNGLDGLALAERCAPDLVLLDIQMPGHSGWETAAQLRSGFGESLRIVMISANAHEFQAGGDGRSSHDAFLSKPIDLDSLLDMIGRQLGLTWTFTEERKAIVKPFALPEMAQPFLADLRKYAKVGHIRAVETVLNDLEVQVPESSGAVAEFRHLIQDFDLPALARRLDDVS